MRKLARVLAIGASGVGEATMLSHFLRMTALAALAVVCVIYPFLPGKFDPLAMAVSSLVQAFGALGTVLLAPVGALSWAQPSHSSGLAVAIAASVVAAALCLAAFAVVGPSLGFLLVGLCFYTGRKLAPMAGSTPLYLVVVPVIVLVCQLVLAAPLTEFSRNRAIASAAELIRAIENYRARQGSYPASLSAVWKDYEPSIVGVERFHYARAGEAYNLIFEQPRFLLDRIGTREFVVYNALGEHAVISHTAWILEMPPAQLQSNQGWYAMHETSNPRWKYFWFD